MKKFLKFIVIFLGILIILLFSVTILAILNKYKIEENKNLETLNLEPKIEEFYSIKNISIADEHLNLQLENKNNNVQILRIYNIKDGQLLKEIILK